MTDLPDDYPPACSAPVDQTVLALCERGQQQGGPVSLPVRESLA